MRPRAMTIAALLVLAACGRAPVTMPAPSGVMPGPGRAATLVMGAPSGAPAAFAPRRPLVATARLTVDATRPLHPASPFVNGFNRNHVQRQFGVHAMDRATFMRQLRRLTPRWGDAYLEALRAQGYPAPATRRALYRTGHGPTDGRTDYPALAGYFFQACFGLDGSAATWDGYAYDDVRYAIQEAEQVDATPLVTVNFGSDTAASAGVLASYLEAPSDPLRGTWPFFVSRAAKPGDAPREAFLVEIGNEISLKAAVGHEKANSVEEYVAQAAPYVRALRAASPHPLKVALDAAVNVYWGGPNDPGGPDAWAQQDAMVRAFRAAAAKAGITFEALQYHGYPTYPVQERLAGNAYAEHLLRTRLLPALTEAGAGAAAGPIEIWNDEFHAASELPRNTGLYGALYAADSVVTALTLSASGRQLMPVTTDFAVWHPGRGNGYDSLYFQDNDATRVTPIYTFRRLLAGHFGDWVLPVALEGGGRWEDRASNGEVTVVTGLHATAARATDGAIHLLVVQRGKVDEEVAFAVPGDLAHATLSALRAAPGVGAPWDAAWDQIAVLEDVPVDLRVPLKLPRGTIAFVRVPPG